MGGTATYWKASLMLCFWLSETSTIQINQSRATAEMNATGVVYTPGVCRGRIVPSRTLLGALYTYRRGYSDSVRSLVGLWKASDSGTSRWGYPAFCMPLLVAKNPLAHGYQSEQHVADRCQIISQLIYLEEDLQEGFSPNHSWNGLAERLICLKY